MAKYSDDYIDRLIDTLENNKGLGWGDAVDVIQWLRQEVKRRDMCLQNLTPGGSEYVNDPERCVAVAKEIRTTLYNQVKIILRQRNEALALLSDIRMCFEDPRLPRDFAAAAEAKIPTGYKDKEERIVRAFEAESNIKPPGPEVESARPHTEYRKALSEWFAKRNIVGRLFRYRPSPLADHVPPTEGCQHDNAEYDSGGAWCPDCGARGTFPGMG